MNRIYWTLTCPLFTVNKLNALLMAQGRFAEVGVAPATRVTRSAQLKRYNRFCKEFTCKRFPCSAKQACLYATHLSEKLAPVSIRNYISGIWYFQKLKGFPDFSEDFILKQTLNGIERSEEGEKLERYPLSPSDMLNMFKLLNMNNQDDLLFWVSALLGFRGLLRICHMTASRHNITAASVHFHTGYVQIRVNSAKNNQFGRFNYSVYLQDMPGSPWCLRALLSGLALGIQGVDPIVSYRLGRICFPLEYSSVNDKLKMLASRLGLPVGRTSTHSFRHGGSTMLSNLNMPVEHIMRKGNWRSGVVRRYLHQSSDEGFRLESIPCAHLMNVI